MALFKKKEETRKPATESIPRLPELPRLPDLPFSKNRLEPPRISPTEYDEPIPQLPTFPQNSFADKFSQNAIKDAIEDSPDLENYTQRGETEEDFDSNEQEDQMIPPLKKSFVKEQRTYTPATRMTQRVEPIFIRLDKFEESMHIIEKTKKEIKEIEEMLADVQKIKSEEEKELAYWQNTLQKIKQDINKIDNDIFSKIE